MIYGFIELDACGLLDRIGFGLGFSGFSFGFGFGFCLDWIWGEKFFELIAPSLVELVKDGVFAPVVRAFDEVDAFQLADVAVIFRFTDKARNFMRRAKLLGFCQFCDCGERENVPLDQPEVVRIPRKVCN